MVFDSSDEMLMMRPHPDATMAGSARRVAQNAEVENPVRGLSPRLVRQLADEREAAGATGVVDQDVDAAKVRESTC